MCIFTKKNINRKIIRLEAKQLSHCVFGLSSGTGFIFLEEIYSPHGLIVEICALNYYFCVSLFIKYFIESTSYHINNIIILSSLTGNTKNI